MHLYVFENSFGIYYLVASLAYSLDMKMEGHKCMIMLVSTVILMVFPYRSSEIYRYAEEDLNLWKLETLPSVFITKSLLPVLLTSLPISDRCRHWDSIPTSYLSGEYCNCFLQFNGEQYEYKWLHHDVVVVPGTQCEINCQSLIDASLKTG